MNGRHSQYRRRLHLTACLAGLGLALAGCAGGPPVPAWQSQAHAALATYTDAALNGDTRVADAEWARARAAVSRTGRADLLARVELTRCALEQAMLRGDDCAAFAALAPLAGDAERAYADYLAGRWTPLDRELLPAAPRAVVSAQAPVRALVEIDDPVSRLVAAGVLLRRSQLSPEGIATAIDTAAAQGWRAALLAWLGLERERRARLNDTDAVRELSARIDIVTGQR